MPQGPMSRHRNATFLVDTSGSAGMLLRFVTMRTRRPVEQAVPRRQPCWRRHHRMRSSDMHTKVTCLPAGRMACVAADVYGLRNPHFLRAVSKALIQPNILQSGLLARLPCHSVQHLI